MKTIGLIGGMSWESTADYYRIINTETNKRLGRYASAKILMYSVNFDDIEKPMSKERWDVTGQLLSSAAAKLMGAGANCVLICTNTMHMNAKDVKNAVSIPLIHIADATAGYINKSGLKKAVLLGTRFTMENDFMAKEYARLGIETVVPEKHERDFIHKVIFDELVKGLVKEDSRDMMLQILDSMKDSGAECAILGCTELGMILKQNEAPMPLFDSARCHSLAAVDFALRK